MGYLVHVVQVVGHHVVHQAHALVLRGAKTNTHELLQVQPQILKVATSVAFWKRYVYLFILYIYIYIHSIHKNSMYTIEKNI